MEQVKEIEIKSLCQQPRASLEVCDKNCGLCLCCETVIASRYKSFKIEVAIDGADSTFVNKTNVHTFVRVGTHGWEVSDNNEQGLWYYLDEYSVIAILAREHTVLETNEIK